MMVVLTLVCLLRVRNSAVALENEKLKLQLSDRERALANVQRSMSLLEHRLSLLAVQPSDISTDPCHHDELHPVYQVLHNIAREVWHLLCFSVIC